MEMAKLRILKALWNSFYRSDLSQLHLVLQHPSGLILAKLLGMPCPVTMATAS